jgi:hypothetical protein
MAPADAGEATEVAVERHELGEPLAVDVRAPCPIVADRDFARYPDLSWRDSLTAR